MTNPTTTVSFTKEKKSTFQTTILLIAFLLLGFNSEKKLRAQISINVNISSQALWGPTGYDYVEYYYLPEADVYYYTPTAQFIYWTNSSWVFVPYLPTHYHINLYSTYKVVINEPKPYLHHTVYVKKYGKYKKGGPKQGSIRDSKDSKYYAVKGHPKHAEHKSKREGNQKSSGNKSQPAKNNKQEQQSKSPQVNRQQSQSPKENKQQTQSPKGGNQQQQSPKGNKGPKGK